MTVSPRAVSILLPIAHLTGCMMTLGPTFDTDCGAAALIRLADRHASLFSGPPLSIRRPVLRPVAVRSISTEARDTLRSGRRGCEPRALAVRSTWSWGVARRTRGT